jgi:hypothetical protein
MCYRKQYVSYMLQPGRANKQVVSVVAKNGKTVAECRTDVMADKVIKGLNLVAEEKRKREEFRL